MSNGAGQLAHGVAYDGAPAYRPVHTPLEELRAEMEDAIAEMRMMGREASACHSERYLAQTDEVVHRLEHGMGHASAHEYLNNRLAVRHQGKLACCSHDSAEPDVNHTLAEEDPDA